MSVYVCNCGKEFADYNERLACLASHTTCTRCGQPMVAGENNNYGMHHVEKCCSILASKLEAVTEERDALDHVSRKGDEILVDLILERDNLASRLSSLQLELDAAKRERDTVALVGGKALTELHDVTSRLEACEAALRSFDVGRESSYWVGGVEKPETVVEIHDHNLSPGGYWRRIEPEGE